MNAKDAPTVCYACLQRLASVRPRVHCITNNVAMNLAANTLLAVGAHPSVTHDPREVTSFTQSARALSVNIGTLDGDRREAIPKAVAAANEAGTPWVFDPVMATRSPVRESMAETVLAAGPTVVRGNTREIDGLSISSGAGRVVASTGPVDSVSDGKRTVRLENGTPLMDRVTAIGCAETALIAAFLAVEDDPFAATVAALLAFNVAGEVAAETAGGPGSFQAALLDSLYALDQQTLQQRSRLS